MLWEHNMVRDGLFMSNLLAIPRFLILKYRNNVYCYRLIKLV
jgi:hypothetical protein